MSLKEYLHKDDILFHEYTKKNQAYTDFINKVLKVAPVIFSESENSETFSIKLNYNFDILKSNFATHLEHSVRSFVNNKTLYIGSLIKKTLDSGVFDFSKNSPSYVYALAYELAELNRPIIIDPYDYAPTPASQIKLFDKIDYENYFSEDVVRIKNDISNLKKEAKKLGYITTSEKQLLKDLNKIINPENKQEFSKDQIIEETDTFVKNLLNKKAAKETTLALGYTKAVSDESDDRELSAYEEDRLDLIRNYRSDFNYLTYSEKNELNLEIKNIERTLKYINELMQTYKNKTEPSPDLKTVLDKIKMLEHKKTEIKKTLAVPAEISNNLINNAQAQLYSLRDYDVNEKINKTLRDNISLRKLVKSAEGCFFHGFYAEKVNTPLKEKEFSPASKMEWEDARSHHAFIAAEEVFKAFDTKSIIKLLCLGGLSAITTIKNLKKENNKLIIRKVEVDITEERILETIASITKATPNLLNIEEDEKEQVRTILKGMLGKHYKE